MCYELITCPRCGEMVNEESWDDHSCRARVKEILPTVEREKERVAEIIA